MRSNHLNAKLVHSKALSPILKEANLEKIQLNAGRHLVMIAAVDEALGIGKNGKIPWNYQEDRDYFKSQTMGHPLIVGRITFESLGGKPLPGRPCAVWSKKSLFSTQIIENTENFKSSPNLFDLVRWCFELNQIVYVCGGQSVYEALAYDATDLLLTRIPGLYRCDRFFPNIFKHFEVKYTHPYQALYLEHWCRSEC